MAFRGLSLYSLKRSIFPLDTTIQTMRNFPKTIHPTHSGEITHAAHPFVVLWTQCLAAALICVLLSGCVDDHGKGDMHAAVSDCFAKYPFAKGTAYQRFNCIYLAHFHYGPAAMGPQYNLLLQVDLASLKVGKDVDSGILTQEEGKRTLHWVTDKAYLQASQPAWATTQPKRN